MPWYRTGTVAITAGQNTVTGTGTAFSANARVGDGFLGPDGRWYEVTNIPSATVLSILPAYQGATVAGGTYALAPLQGYVKESADRLRQLVNDWGGTLAGLGSVSTENVVPVAKGGTGGNTPALGRSGLGLGSAAVAALVGTVTQAGAAVFERGGNANGDFVKLADGTMICSMSISVTDQAINSSYTGGIFLGSRTWTFPAQFSGAPAVIPGAFLWGNAASWAGMGASVNAASCMLRGFDVVARAAGSTTLISALAIGRWS